MARNPTGGWDRPFTEQELKEIADFKGTIRGIHDYPLRQKEIQKSWRDMSRKELFESMSKPVDNQGKGDCYADEAFWNRELRRIFTQVAVVISIALVINICVIHHFLGAIK